jgi:2-keto-myo-inositol isomerase
LVVAGAGPLGSDVNTAAGYFREVCELAQPFAVEVALEFEGPVGESENLETAWAVVDGAEAENGGLVLDTFQFWGTESTEETLEAVPVEKLSLVQVSDSMELPRYELRDHHRVYPGAGAIPLDSILALVAGKGYHGYYSLELANEDYWAEDPVVVARDGMRALRRVQVA